jgi:hypothetical protein
MVADGEKYHILIDEIQFVCDVQNPYVDNPDARISFIDVGLGFLQMSRCVCDRKQFQNAVFRYPDAV